MTNDAANASNASASPARRPRAVRAARSPRAAGPRAVEGKRTLILDAALDCFSRYGLHGTSVDQVAALAEVSKSNLLYYFGTKEELYVAVLKDLLTLWLAPLKALRAEQDPLEAIGEYIRLKLIVSRDHPRASRLFCLEIIQGAPLLRTELEHGLREIVDAKVDVIRAWIAQGRLQPVDPHHLIFALWALTQHYADFSVQVESLVGRSLADPPFFEQVLDNVRQIVLRGVGVAPTDAPTDTTLSAAPPRAGNPAAAD